MTIVKLITCAFAGKRCYLELLGEKIRAGAQILQPAHP
jgi:hypothetical protein